MPPPMTPTRILASRTAAVAAAPAASVSTALSLLRTYKNFAFPHVLCSSRLNRVEQLRSVIYHYPARSSFTKFPSRHASARYAIFRTPVQYTSQGPLTARHVRRSAPTPHAPTHTYTRTHTRTPRAPQSGACTLTALRRPVCCSGPRSLALAAWPSQLRLRTTRGATTTAVSFGRQSGKAAGAAGGGAADAVAVGTRGRDECSRQWVRREGKKVRG